MMLYSKQLCTELTSMAMDFNTGGGTAQVWVPRGLTPPHPATAYLAIQ